MCPGCRDNVSLYHDEMNFPITIMISTHTRAWQLLKWLHYGGWMAFTVSPGTQTAKE